MLNLYLGYSFIVVNYWTTVDRNMNIIMEIHHKHKGKAIPVFNKIPCHEDKMGEWKYGATPSHPH